jgi:hypothetical protein
MKKIQVNSAKLQLNKQKISTLTNDQMENMAGGQANQLEANAGFTGGCSDGCGIFQSAWNCSKANCTGDCAGGGSIRSFLC